MRIAFCLLLLTAPSAALCMERNEADCLASLQRAYSFFAARSDAVVRGDFNGDGRDDWATLMDRKAQPAKAAIGVCLSGEPRPLLITSQHRLARITVEAKGSAYDSVANDVAGVFELDAISVSDGSGKKWSYILRAGTFAQVASRD